MNHSSKNISNRETFKCSEGLMQGAIYERGNDEIPPNIDGLQKGFLILVDTHFKAQNFISFTEQYLREHSLVVDTSLINWQDGWEKLTIKQKLERGEQEKRHNKIYADSLHYINNQKQQVWIFNNTEDTVSIQMQDWSYICVLQARTKSKQWYPIQYWQFSQCGNSYYCKYLPPHKANSFITQLPKEGDYQTKLRYKLLGEKTYYYSNEFDGKINYCEFVEDSIKKLDGFYPHFKLDTLVELSWCR